MAKARGQESLTFVFNRLPLAVWKAYVRGDHGFQIPATVQVKAGEMGEGKDRWLMSSLQIQMRTRALYL